MLSDRKAKNRYRRFSYVTDVPGIKTSLLNMRGIGFPKQPKLNKGISVQCNGEKFHEEWFFTIIQEKVLSHPLNKLEYPFCGEHIFDQPIIGFVRGDDPIWTEYKKIIGPFHFNPEEIMGWQAKNNGVEAPKADEISVVSYILPISKKTKEDEAFQVEWLSERWAQTRRSGCRLGFALVAQTQPTRPD
ncbi:MAG TPA: hypothetical protein VN441_09855 [Syntrophomonas sp.]|nr:hypothetical protein [Syntrophomonas sp.]